MRGMAPLRVGVIFGGRSGEHEVSLASAASVIAALEHRGHAVVPIGIGRDGRWVVGGDPLRALASQARVGLPSGDATGAVKKALADRAESADTTLASTALVRMEPAGGMPAELRAGLDVVIVMLHGPYGEDGTVQGLLELADVPYVGAGVLASAVGMDKATMKAVFSAHRLPIVEYTVVLRREWRERPAQGARREGQARITVPAPIGPALTARVREIAVAAFRAIDASGMARVDFFLEGDRVVLNEINTIPGFTATSAYARLWEATGLAYGELIERLIALALERHRDTRNSG